MFKWRSTNVRLIALLLSLCLATSATAAPFVCRSDIDGNGDATESGETASCVTSDNADQLCPIGAVACDRLYPDVCPVPGNVCTAGVCETPATCDLVDVFGTDDYVCPTIVGQEAFFGSDETACNTACASASQACSGPPPSDVCPLDSTIACVNHAGVSQCSLNTCIDLATTPPEGVEFESTMLLDDGERSADGECLASPLIFSGRAMACLPKGANTVWQNCCKASDKIYTDSTGSSVQSTLTNKAILATFQAARAAYTAYAAYTAVGASSAVASAQAASSATNAFAGAFDPTSLAIAIAVALIMEYLAKACPQESLEAAALMASDYCVELGTYCKSKWFGSCVQKARAQCCFNSKLAKIVHEQGRSQLATFDTGFGDIDAPNCRGFSPEEFQALDFSRIDMTEYYDDLTAATTATIQQTLQDGVDDFVNEN